MPAPEHQRLLEAFVHPNVLQRLRDPITHLFVALPEAHEDDQDLNDDHRRIAYCRALTWYFDKLKSSPPSSDPDAAYIEARAVEAPGAFNGPHNFFLQQLGALALHKISHLGNDAPLPAAAFPGHPADYRSAYMRYGLWIARGRREAENPFRGGLGAVPEAAFYTKIPLKVTAPDQKCNTCGAAGASQLCAGCLSEEYAGLSVRYCGRKCQKEHWPKHKVFCGPAKRLARAVSLLNEVFLMFESETYAGSVAKVWERNGLVYIVDYPYDPSIDCADDLRTAPQTAQQKEDALRALDDAKHGVHTMQLNDRVTPNNDDAVLSPSAFKGDFFIKTFPTHVLPSGISPGSEKANAVLLQGECGEIAKTLGPLLDLFLKPLVSRLEGAVIWPKNGAWATCVIRDGKHFNGMFDDHLVIRATLSNGQAFAIDFTGSQFGWSEKLSPWKHFVSYRCRGVKEYQSLDDIRQCALMLEMMGGSQSYAAVLTRVRQNAMDAMVHAINACIQGSQAASIKEFLDLPTAEFANLRSEVVLKASAAVKGVLAQMRTKDTYRVYLDEKLNTAIITEERMAKKLKSVWMSEEEYEQLAGKPAALKAAWKAKLEAAS